MDPVFEKTGTTEERLLPAATMARKIQSLVSGAANSSGVPGGKRHSLRFGRRSGLGPGADGQLWAVGSAKQTFLRKIDVGTFGPHRT